MGERLLCKQEVVGSIPSASTRTLVSRRHRGASLGLEKMARFSEIRRKESQHGNVRLAALLGWWSGIMDSVKKKCK